MHWIALRWLPDPHDTPGATDAANAPALPPPEALGWWALQYTPHVAWQDEALMLEVSACERLWGGRLQLMRQLVATNPVPDVPGMRMLGAQGATSLVALARLRLFACGEARPQDVPAGLPLETLSVAHPHLDLLARLGCRTWGDVAALPRGGLTRRFGTELRVALDAAWGLRPESHAWLTLPDVFEQKLELPALAETGPELMWSANRLLSALQIWLRARQRGARALELEWTLDLKRFNGVNLPPHQQVTVRTAEPTQDMAHLRRLLSEKLALATLAAPASWLKLRTLETDPWAGASASFLPEDNRKGDKLHEMVERLSVRLGARQVLVPCALADHRPERKQAWRPALQKEKDKAPDKARKQAQAAASQPDALYPSWLLPEPLLLEMDGERPCYRGPLSRLVGPQRVEAGWWGGKEEGGRPALRDYYVAESPGAGLVWIFRERPAVRFSAGEVRWYLQGLYA
jgi:protein ImuB